MENPLTTPPPKITLNDGAFLSYAPLKQLRIVRSVSIPAPRHAGPILVQMSGNLTNQESQRGGLNQNMGSSAFTFRFDDAKARPNLLLLHRPSLHLTIHIPSHSEGAERVSQLPLMCPVLACVTTP